MKLVSIIVPVYNREKVIEKCYLSLISQTYSSLEIIFVDDGSSDRTLEVIKSFNSSKVKVISQKNAGPAEARRNGFNNSLGEYICFVDSDDTISKDFIMRLVTKLEDNNSVVSMGRVGLHIDMPIVRKLIFKSKKKPEVFNLSSNKEYLPALNQAVIGKLFKREVLDMKSVEFRANEDIIFMYPFYAKVDKIVSDNGAIYHNYYARVSQRNLLFGYKYDTLYNTFGPLKIVYDEYKKMNLLDAYYSEIEMLFIRNIFERINNLSDCVSDKIYQYKFISALLDYLECFFPNWDKNKYYLSNFKLGEITDRLRLINAKKKISKIGRKKLDLTLDEVYNRYKSLEELYEKNKGYISRI